ncbi:MAG: SIS domain-containing protein [Nitrososphaerota archaeon]|nr:hypothetical protein [Candidatus Geocrenenecus dongiae]
MFTLDDLNVFREVPYGTAFNIIGNTPRVFSEYLKIGMELGSNLKERFTTISKIVYIGIGGSAIAGDIFSTLLKSSISLLIHRDYIPIKLTERDLAIFVSYSGETAEIFPTLLSNFEKKNNFVFITSGGRLKKIAEKYGVPLIELEHGIPPRYALPSMLAGLIGIAESYGLLREDDLEKAIKDMENVKKNIDVNMPLDKNISKKIAVKLFEKIPVIYAYGNAVPIGYRFKCQLNENAKVFSHFSPLPEALHNDVEAITEECVIVTPRVSNETPEITRVYEALSTIFQDRFIDLKVDSVNLLGEILSLLLILDYSSLYLSILRRVDPLKLYRIPEFKSVNKIYEEILKRVDERLGL